MIAHATTVSPTCWIAPVSIHQIAVHKIGYRAALTLCSAIGTLLNYPPMYPPHVQRGACSL